MKFERYLIKNDLGRAPTDRRTDGQDRQTGGQAENNRAPPTFVGRAVINRPVLDCNANFSYTYFDGRYSYLTYCLPEVC